jgi:hypothetical protein
MKVGNPQDFAKEWNPPETLPTEERVLGCYYNIWGFKYITEVYHWADAPCPETLIGMPVNKLLGWLPLPTIDKDEPPTNGE